MILAIARNWLTRSQLAKLLILAKAFTKHRVPLRLEQLEPRSLSSLFAPAVNYPVGYNPYSVAVGDFNGDGKLDLAVANHGDSNVEILLGNGDGTFMPGKTVPTDSTPIFVATADLNHDGKLDLVTGNEFSNDISVLLGNGDGTFQSAVNYATGLETVGVAIGDFNKDGIPDLAVASQGPGEVFVLLGNGDGTFQPAVGYACGTFAREVAVGDFNGDGNLDLVVANQGENTVSVLLGNGDGTFQPGTKFATGPGPTSVKVGDFLGNGVLDIVTANYDFSGGDGGVSVLLGNGDGTFQATQTYATDLFPDSVALADFNNDSRLDIAVANSGGNDVSVLLNNGDGTFQSALNFAAGSAPSSVAAGDFNGQGVQSLAVANGASDNVSILINTSITATGLSPDSMIEGGGDFTLSVMGSGFSNSSTIEWNGTPLPTTFVSSSEVQATVPAADVVDEGSASITVVNPGSTAPLKFTILDDDALSATGYNLAGTEGNEINSIVATFTDVTYPTNSPDDFTANINWGDGASSTGIVTSQGGLFVVRGSHTYAEKGSYSITVATQDDGDGLAAANTQSTVNVADAPLTASGVPVNATEGQPLHATVATFTDSNPNALASDFTATVDWGNGTTSPEGIHSLGNGRFEVVTPGFSFEFPGQTPYSEEGHFTVTTTIKDVDGSQAIATSTATVADAPLSATGTPVHAVEGMGFSGQVATFTDANLNAGLEDFTPQGPHPAFDTSNATIDWGDGTSSAGDTYVDQPGGLGTPFVISGSHTYTKSGPYTIKVTIFDNGGSTATTTTTATVTDPDDIVGRVNQSGQLWTGVSTGSSFSTSLWGAWNPAATWVDVVRGDFNGDGLIDIAGRDKQTGNWWVSLSTGSGFTNSLWTTWNPNVTWVDVQVGDFTGDGKADIVGRVLETGQWWVAQSTGSSFTNSLWATWNPMATWVDVKVGDFDGDGKADITGRYMQGGSWWTGVSTGSSFSTSMWTVWSTAVTWVDVQVGDFNGDGFADIAGRALETGQWWVGFSNGSKGGPPVIHPVPATGFENVFWTSWSTAVTWVDVKVGDFNGDGSTDIIGRTRETSQWWVSLSPFMPCLESCVMNTNPQTLLFATWSTAVTWVDVQVGDFNGDGKADITGRALQSGQWWTGISNGSAFNTSLWATWSTAVNWVDVRSGDFA